MYCLTSHGNCSRSCSVGIKDEYLVIMRGRPRTRAHSRSVDKVSRQLGKMVNEGTRFDIPSCRTCEKSTRLSAIAASDSPKLAPSLCDLDHQPLHPREPDQQLRDDGSPVQALIDSIPDQSPFEEPSGLRIPRHIRIPHCHRNRPQHLSVVRDMVLAIRDDLIGRPKEVGRSSVVIRR